MSESNAEFIARMRFLLMRNLPLTVEEFERLIALADERVMIEENRLEPRWNREYEAWYVSMAYTVDPDEWSEDLSTAIRSVVEKIGGSNE